MIFNETHLNTLSEKYKSFQSKMKETKYNMFSFTSEQTHNLDQTINTHQSYFKLMPTAQK